MLAIGRIPGPAQGHKADDWSRETARRMAADRYCPSAIIRYLEAYGLSFYAAQALVREMPQ